MRLLYCYIRFLDKAGNEIYYHGQKSVELNLSTNHRFFFYADKNEFVRKERKAPLPVDFWTNQKGRQEHCNIYNINVIAGQNGSGKTTAIRSVMNMLKFFYDSASGIIENNSSISKEQYNQYLLLFESNSEYYLLSYTPTEEETRDPILMKGFSNCVPLVYSCTDREWLYIDQNKICTDIRSLLSKTKVIHMTNTLNQYDYERNSEEQNDHARDSFIFDVSIGATIGHDAGQFFLHEIYKQVKYVFDKNQADLRKKIEEQTKKKITGYTIPDILRIRLRLEHYQDYFAKIGYTFSELDDTSSDIVEKLWLTCVGAYAENLKIRIKNNDFSATVPKSSINDLHKNTLALKKPQQMILDIEKNYYDVKLCKYIKVMGSVSDLYSLPDGRIMASMENGRIVFLNTTNEYKEDLRIDLGIDDRLTCAVYYSKDKIVAGSSDGSVWIYDIAKKSGTICHKFNGYISSIVVSPDGKRVYCISSNGEICVVDGNAIYQKGKRLAKPDGTVTDIIVTQDNHFFCCSFNGNVYECYKEKYKYPFGETQSITCIKLLLDNRIIAGMRNGCLCVWNHKAAEATVHVWNKRHSNSVGCIAISSDGSKIVSATYGGEIYVWDSRTEECIYEIYSNKRIIKVAILSNGRVFGWADKQGLYTWDVPGGILLQKEQKRMLNAIEEDNCNKSKSTIKHEEGTEKLIKGMGFEHILTENCLRYIKYIFEKKSALFGQMHKIRNDLFELSLKENRTDGFAQDMIQFMQKYRYTCEPAYTIDFDWGLSSGEENMLRIFSDLYHIFDRDYSSGEYGDYKIYNKKDDIHHKSTKIECDTVLMFMDEADLTLHPEWQRCLIDTLITYIPQVYPVSCAKDIQLILTTHSPLLLGDIPSENVTYLYNQKENEQGEKNVKPNYCKPSETFGQNIHTILRDSFFLSEGTVGAFAAKKINNAAERMIEIKKEVSNFNADISSFQIEMREIQEIINVVAHGVLRTKLENLYQETMDALEEKNKPQHRKAQKLLETLWELSPEDQQYVIDAINQEKSEND